MTTNWAYRPLTLFDGTCSTSSIFIGWLVEGSLSVEKIEGALHRLVAKWPMLAGRIEQLDKMRYSLKIPLGPLPNDYRVFCLTVDVSMAPITSLLKIPISTISDPPPVSLFVHPSTPSLTKTWADQQLPIMYWHLTRFEQPGQEYTCIGLTMSHALVDGPGLGMIVRALQAEMLTKPWGAPPIPPPASNQNELQLFLDRAQKRVRSGDERLPQLSEYPTISFGGLWFILCFMVHTVWQQLWHGATRKNLLLPSEAVERLVQDANLKISHETAEKIDLSAGDVLTAWLFKAVYTDERRSGCRVNLCNMSSIRKYAPAELKFYPHNCFVPNQYPLMTVSELKAISVHQLAHKLAKAKEEQTLGHALLVYECLQKTTGPPGSAHSLLTVDSNADENFTISNMSESGIVKFDWSGAGGGRTVARYKKVFSTIQSLIMSNILTISGETDDGRILVDVALNARRMKSLEKAVEQLVKATSTGLD